jgi:hypothetical protein
MADTAVFRVLDTRVGASIDRPTPTDLVVKASTDTAVAIATLADMAYRTKMNRLLLICHSGHSTAGEWWLDLGAPGIRHNNIDVVNPLRGKFGGDRPRIELRGCWIATNGSGRPDDVMPANNSGAALCHRIADLVGVEVWGSDSEQPGPCGEFAPMEVDERLVTDGGTVNIARKQVPIHRECSEGVWKGKVYIYRPNRSGAELYDGPR